LVEPPGNARQLRLDPTGVWVAQEESDLSYPEEGNDLCYALEENSFWFRHRNDVLVSLLRRFPPPGVFFDVGGGNGFVAAGIEKAGYPTVLVEPGPAGVANARRRGLRTIVRATTASAGFAPAALPAVGLFDVLEHIEDDIGFLRSLHTLLQPGGRIYLTVPAYRLLWSQEDVFAGHHRRYTTRSLAAALSAAGFQVEYRSYFFWFLPLPVFLLRAVPSWLGWRGKPSAKSAQKEHARGGGLSGWLLAKALAWERGRLARGWTMPMGSSCFAVARRPGEGAGMQKLHPAA
jgi:SAM-dependent methyltransferase